MISFTEYLYQCNKITQHILEHLSTLNNHDEQIRYLINSNRFTMSEIENEFNQYESVEFFDLSTLDESFSKTNRLPEKFAKKHQAIVVEKNDHSATIAVSNPNSTESKEALMGQLQMPINLVMAPIHSIEQIMRKIYTQKKKIQAIANEIVDSEQNHTLNDSVAVNIANQIDAHHSLDQFVNQMLTEAIRIDATDIHIEYNNNKLQFNYRVTQTLTEPISLNIDMAYPLRQKLMLLGNGLITEMHRPHDLSFHYKAMGKEISTRLSIMPTINGYSIVIRIFHQNDMSFFNLKNLITNEKELEKTEVAIEYSSGLVLISGPVNSGKTSLTYAALLIHNEKKQTILSIENPVEVRFPDLNQIEPNDQLTGLDHQSIIRTSVRQNPDVISFGEIRDSQLAALTINTASIGIKVYATIHANNAMQTILRIINMNIDNHLLSSVLRAIFSQRLMQKLCPSCLLEYPLSNDEVTKLQTLKNFTPTKKVYTAKGCAICSFTGRSGITSITEQLDITPELRDAIIDKNTKLIRSLVTKQMTTCSLPFRALERAYNKTVHILDVIKLVDNYEC